MKIREFLENNMKTAGVLSEVGASLNPLNIIGSPIGAMAAGFTPTRTDAQQAEAEQNGASNILVPGKGAYNYYKRLGHMAKNEGGYGGVLSEQLSPSMIASQIPIPQIAIPGAVATVGGAALAGLTPTRTPEQQQERGNSAGSIARNLLLPGAGIYSAYKRIGNARAHPVQGDNSGEQGAIEGKVASFVRESIK